MSLSLRARARIILTIAAIVPALAVGSLAIYRASTEVESEVVRGRLAQVRAMAASLDQTLQGARHSLELAAAWWADERSLDSADSEESLRVMDRLWRRLHRDVAMFSSLSIVDVTGKTLYGRELTVDPKLGAHSFGGLVGDVVYDHGKPYVPIVTQARNRSGERIGVLVARLDLGFVAESIDDTSLGSNARIIVVDGLGQAIARTDGMALERTVLLDEVISKALGRSQEGKLERDGQLLIYRNLIAFQDRRAVPWALIFEQPSRDAFALARRAAWDTSIIALLVLALALILGAVLASRITRPLARLARRADAIAEGSDPGLIDSPIDGPGEIGALARRVEEMANKIGEREKLQAALAHEDRLATVGTMAASVAHEINNPLTTILGYSNLLLEDTAADDASHASLRLIADEAERMKVIVGGMLEYARRDIGQGRVAELGEVLSRVKILLAPSLKKMKVNLVCDHLADAGQVAASAQHLQQIFVNLIQNAAQAMPKGGTVTVQSSRAGDTLVLLIRDEGAGIPEAAHAQVFEAFYTTKQAGQGTGLGLAVVKHLVSEFRGTIEVLASDGGGGTRMKLVIPMLVATETAETHPPR